MTPGGGGTLSLRWPQLGVYIMMRMQLRVPVSTHLNFLGEDEVLYRYFVLKDPVPSTATVILDFAQVLCTKQDPAEGGQRWLWRRRWGD